MMNTLKNLLTEFRTSEDGATLVEYGIALVLAVSVGAGALSVLATNVNQNMTDACETIGDAASCTVAETEEETPA